MNRKNGGGVYCGTRGMLTTGGTEGTVNLGVVGITGVYGPNLGVVGRPGREELVHGRVGTGDGLSIQFGVEGNVLREPTVEPETVDGMDRGVLEILVVGTGTVAVGSRSRGIVLPRSNESDDESLDQLRGSGADFGGITRGLTT